MKESVFVPSHITGIFNINESQNPLEKGSCGAGFLLNKGVITKIKESSKDDVSIIINGKDDKKNDLILKETLKLLNIDSGLKITQNIQVPIGSGFGTSASSALGLAIASSKLLDLNYDFIKCGEIAHLAEVRLGSGLGDVIAELSKGLVERIKAGAPGNGLVRTIKIPNKVYVTCKTFSKINTKDIILNDNYKNIINDIGTELLFKFGKNPNLENFLKYSLEFSKKTNLISKDVLEAIEIFNKNKEVLGSSMAMLGNTVFALSLDENVLKSIDIDGLNFYEIDLEGIKID
jgi:pantoate kinase